jgi:K+-transporting ATPase ATPase C chain
MNFFKQLYRSFLAMVLFMLLLGLIYPLIVTGIGKVFFHKEADGSLIMNTNREIVGSSLIGQNFQSPKYFFSRPSASNYDALNSGGTNLSPESATLTAAIEARVKALQAAHPGQTILIPIDLVTSSASGLDPDISVASAYYQAPRIANARHLTLGQVEQLIKTHTTSSQLGFLGESRVNVLKLNIALDQLN